MDEHDVEKCLITPSSCIYDFGSVEEECGAIAELTEHYHDRFAGGLMLENTRDSGDMVVMSVEDYELIAGRMPAMVCDKGTPPKDETFYPHYHEA
jgi:hypothetical protein